METIWKDSADEILGKLRQKRSNAWISNETIYLAADKREARKRGYMTEFNSTIDWSQVQYEKGGGLLSGRASERKSEPK